MQFTFEIVAGNQAHLLATVLAYGRETLVPVLFRSIQQNLPISSSAAPNLYAYLHRHIQLDEQEHGPIVVQMAHELCADSTRLQIEAAKIKRQALAARLVFWDEIYQSLNAGT